MRNQFSRTLLHFGQEGMERLNHARVTVFGIGALDLIGDDRVCLTNLNRQLLASRKTVGQYKVDVAEQRAKKFNPDAVVSAIRRFRWSPIILRSITASCLFGIWKRMCGMSMHLALLKAVRQSFYSMSRRC